MGRGDWHSSVDAPQLMALSLANDFRTYNTWNSRPSHVPFMTLQQPRIELSHLTTQTQTENKNNSPHTHTGNKKMSKPSLFPVTFLYLVLFFLHTQLSFCNRVSVLGLDSLKNSEMDVMVKRDCSQTIGECLTETEMDSETNRRVLAMQKKFISYETLRRDMTPCANPGAPYYNCHSGVANPYNRGCEVITRCARGIIKT